MKNSISTIMLFLSATLLNAQKIDTSYVQIGSAKLHTVLTKPNDKDGIPLTIFIAGSGPTDLNGNQPNMQNNSLKYLSDALVENDIATLRFDKRGIAKSALQDFNEADLKIDDYANDVTSLIEYARQKGYSKIYIAGHSEGSLIGLIALQNTAVSGFISIAGAGNSADMILKNQLKPKLPLAFYAQVETIIDSLKNGHRVTNVPPQLNSLFRPSVQPYLISWFKYTPAELMGNLNCPALIIQGDKDIQVSMDEAKKLKEGLNEAHFSGINNMNHVLKTISGDIQENVASYSNPDLPINKDLVSEIVKFINK